MEHNFEEDLTFVDKEEEIKSLQRVMDAYSNYPSAAEEDVRRWERTYSRLRPDHQALLPHLPAKYNEIRRCIATNAYFINYMLQSFEPPFASGTGPSPAPAASSQDCTTNSNCSATPYDKDPRREDPSSLLNESLPVLETLPVGNVKPSQGIGMTNENAFPTDTNLDTRDVNGLVEGRDVPQNTGCRLKEDCYNGASEPPRQKMNEGAIPSQMSHLGAAEHNQKCHRSDDSQGTRETAARVPLADVDKIRCVLRNIVRDWAAEGQQERQQCYNPIIEELHRLYWPQLLRSSGSCSGETVDCGADRPKCLVPGAGLGRLACEISRMGFICQGNEFSYYMLMCSSFILNQTEMQDEFTLYPWITSSCNVTSDVDQLRPVKFPDLLPWHAGITEGFSMCAGDFLEVYGHPSQAGAWDCVVTCFFIDTAHNVLNYLEVIYKTLKPGGVWINLGPLLYHFADAYSIVDGDEEISLEVSLEDVKLVALKLGFQIDRESSVEATYTANGQSMMQNRYTCAFWTMIKGTKV